MATLNVEGRRVKIDDGFLNLSPEEQERTVGEIASSLGIQAKPQTVNAAPKTDREMGWGETLTDVAGGLGTGLARGLAGIAGLPGDIDRFGSFLGKHAFRQTVGRADNYFRTGDASAPSMEEMYQKEADFRAQMPFSLPTPKDVISSNQTQAGLEAIAGPLPEPQTTTGQYAKTVGEFVPGAILAPGTLGQKAALATIPPVASETAGQLTEGTEAEPFARIGGALLGGLATAGGQGRAVSKALENAPAKDTIKQASQRAYDQADQIGFQVEPMAMRNFVQRVVRDTKADGLHSKLHPKATAALEHIVDETLLNPSLKNIETARKILGEAARSIEPAERRFASIIMDKLDDFVENLNPAQVISGDPQRATGLLKEARQGWAQYRKTDLLDNAMEAAKNTASGFENGLRIEFRKILNNPKKLRGFSGEERRALQDVVRGNSLQNALTVLGKFGFDFSRLGNKATLIPGLASGGALYAGEPLIAGSIAAVGTGAKYLARRGANKMAERAQATTRLSKAEQGKLGRARKDAELQATLKRLLTADTPRRTTD